MAERVYKTILDGKLLHDVATGESGETSGSTYNYYGYLHPSGTWCIMRELSDESEYRFLIGKSSYSSAWTNRATFAYQYITSYPYSA